MKAFDNELRGVLFKNKDKEQGDKKPDYTGSATIKGADYFMDAWINASESGRKYMSVKFKEKQAQQPKDTRTLAERNKRPLQDMPDDVPF